MRVYSIKVIGKHSDLSSKLYYGLALGLEDALNLACEKAQQDGWSEIDIDSVDKFAAVSFAPWLSKDSEDYFERLKVPENNDNEVQKCQQ